MAGVTLEQARALRRRAPHRRRSCRSRRWSRAEGRRPASARAGPRGHRGRARSRARSPCTASTSTPTADPLVLRHRGALLDGHLHPHAGRRPRPAAAVAARTSATCAAPRSAASAWTRRASPDDVRAASLPSRPCATTRTSRSTPTWRPLVRHGRVLDRTDVRRATARGRCSTPTASCWRCTKRSVRTAKPAVVIAADARERPGATADPRGHCVGRPERIASLSRASSSPTSTAPPWPGERTVVTIGAYDGVHLGHQAVIAARARGSPRSVGARSVVITFDRHPASIVRPEIGAEAAHRSRPEARAAGGDRRRRHRASSTSTRRSRARSPRTSCERVLVDCLADVGRRRRRRLPLRPRPRRQRRRCSASSGVERLRGASAASSCSAPTASTSRSAPRPSAGRWPVARSSSPRRCSAGRSRPAASWCTATSAAGCSASPRPTSRCPTPMCLPADGVYAGWYVRPDGERPRLRDQPRPPADVLRARRPLAARGPPARLRRRPLRRARRGAVHPLPAQRAQVRRHRRLITPAEARHRARPQPSLEPC